MKVRYFIWAILSVALLSFGSCNETEPVEVILDPVDQPYVTTPYDFETPIGFSDMIIPEDNPLTVEGVSLGRMLFYDDIMDKDSARNCASCHIQNEAFQKENGLDQVLVHVNFAWSYNYMWEGSFTGTLEEVMLFEVEHFFETDISRLNNSEMYRDLFKKAFDVDVITSKEAAYALAQFERIMVSGNSRFDQFLRGETMLTEQERQGLVLYNTEEAD
jgi:cytochrome c peroxidase